MKSQFVIAALLFASASAFAGDAARQAAADVTPLKDGGTLYLFKDGKMAKEDRFGRAEYLRAGETLLTASDKQVPVTSNEVARLSYLLSKGHSNH
jgi:hypothetical protein